MAGAAALAGRVATGLGELRGELFGFVPVGLGIGIGLWFQRPVEPGAAEYALALVGVALAALLWRIWVPVQPLAVFAACILCGYLACGVRVALVAAPMLEGEWYGAVTGRIVGIDRSQSGALRLTLDRVWLEDVAPAATPARVRLSLQGDQRWLDPLRGPW